MKTIFILVDALKSNYLTEENMPFLYGLSKTSYYIKEVIPSPGFCERSEIFSGLDSFDTGNFSAIGYLPSLSPYRKDRVLCTIAGFFDSISMKYTRFFANKIRVLLQRRMNFYRIPFNSLWCFALTEDGTQRFVPHNDIFDNLHNAGLTYSLDAFTSLSDLGRKYNGTIEQFIDNGVQNKIDFLPAYIGIIDSVGHRFGDDITHIRPYLKDVDDQLRRVYETAMLHGYAFCVLGDHGMVPVTKKLDVMSKVRQLPLKLGKDYEAFYDSTTVRFWIYNEKSKKLLHELMETLSVNYGVIVDKSNYVKYRVPLDIESNGRAIYGDILWCANPGILISPDYFHAAEDPEKGMHGYLKVVPGDGTGIWIANSPMSTNLTVSQAHSSIICSELCKLLEINTPNKNNWKREVVYG